MNKTCRSILVCAFVLAGTAVWALPAAAADSRQSIRKWVSCKEGTDDAVGAARAFADAKNGAFTLLVDCPVTIHVGMDITRAIFIDNGTTVEFTGDGKFVVDNTFIPTFVIANSVGVTLTNWRVVYDAALPVDVNVAGYQREGKFVAGSKPGNAFNDQRITPWLVANRGITFDGGARRINSYWQGTTNTCAVFFVLGDTSNLTITGMQVQVPAAAGVERFVPVVFALGLGYKSNQRVTGETPMTAQYAATPHDVVFKNVEFDGTYMGWVGSVRNAVFDDIKSHRYGDLQDAAGGNVGGAAKWYAPPHLFYLSYKTDGDPALFNQNLQIKNVVDDGPRVGIARDKGGADTVSGYALSIKIGCVHCSVDNYRTNRPDGFLDVLPSDGLKISNVTATFDSAFLNNMFPGWRFPSTGYKNLTFENITLTDTAPSSVQLPIGNSNQASNENIVFKNVKVRIHRWAGQGRPVPTIGGRGNSAAIDVKGDNDQ